jgi:hypothetical protein
MTSLDADIRPEVAVFMMGFKYGYTYLRKRALKLNERTHLKRSEHKY